MNKPLLTVTKFEFIRQVKKPAFWITVLLIPLLMAIVFIISLVVRQNGMKSSTTIDGNTTFAITDEAGILPSDTPYVINGDREYGISMVKNGEVDLYFYIPADFSDTKKVDLYHISEGLDVFNSDGEVIKAVLSQSVSSKFTDIEITALTGNFQINDNKLNLKGEDSNAIGKAIIPLAFFVVFFIFVCLFGGRLLMAVVEEKENRISEMILTSVSARHLIIGKIFAMMLLGVVQILAIVIPGIVVIFINRENPAVSGILSSISFDPLSITMSLLLFIFSVFLEAGLLTYVGAITPTAKDASQFIGPVIIGVAFPLYFMQIFLASDPNFMVYFLTYFPLSAPTALMLRSAFGTLSTPEFLIGLTEIIILSCIVIKLTVRTFEKNVVNFGIAKPKLNLLKNKK